MVRILSPYFYPVCPASDTYAIGAPYFPQMQINLENGKAIRILTENCVDGCGDCCREGCEEGKRLNCYHKPENHRPR